MLSTVQKGDLNDGRNLEGVVRADICHLLRFYNQKCQELKLNCNESTFGCIHSPYICCLLLRDLNDGGPVGHLEGVVRPAPGHLHLHVSPKLPTQTQAPRGGEQCIPVIP